MTLRQLLHSLATDEAARTEFLADPASALARSGFEGLDEQLLGTALVHHADTAPVDHLDALVPLLDRFAPLPDHPRGTPETDGPGDHLDTEVDPGLLFDDLGPTDPGPGPPATDPAEDQAADTTPSSDRSDRAAGDDSGDLSHSDFGTGAIPITAMGAAPPASPPHQFEPDAEPEWSSDAATITPQIDLPPTDPQTGNALPPERVVDDARLHDDDAFDALD